MKSKKTGAQRQGPTTSTRRVTFRREARLKVHTPLISLTKAQIVKEGLRLGLDYSQTSSCYDPGGDGRPCGACDSCLLRAKGFAEVGVKDPLYARFGMT